MTGAAHIAIRSLVLLALVLRLVPAPPWPAGIDLVAADGSWFVGAAICHSDSGGDPATDDPAPPIHDCALCPICLTHVTPLVLPRSVSVVMVVPSVVPARPYAEPPATGPPPSRFTAARPRAPPAA